MLVPAMTPIEIYKEIIEDGTSVLKMITTKLRIKTFEMKRLRQFIYTETLNIKSTRGNDWSVYLNIQGNGTPQTAMYVKTIDGQGFTAYNFIMVEDLPMLIKYNAHFFKRYRERMQLEETKPQRIIKNFFRNNIKFTPAFSEKDENGNIMACIALPEGMGYGRFSESSPITEMKTFIANDILNKGQRELSQMLNEDDFYKVGISFL